MKSLLLRVEFSSISEALDVHPSQTCLGLTFSLEGMTEGLYRFYGGHDLHFLTFSCYQRRPMLHSAARCDLLLQILERVRRRYRLVVVGYAI